LNNPAVYLSGQNPRFPGPLGRYLAPLADGIGAAWLHEHVPPGTWALDPFGASPRLLVEAARAGYRLLAAVNNPIARFITELYADPPAIEDLRLALTDLAGAPGSGERLEPLIRSLYRSECAQCGSEIELQALIWEREARTPVAKIYTCPVCKDSGERPLSPQDIQRANQGASAGLHRARALERVAPLADPDRLSAEEALSVYPPRAISALIRLVNRLELLPENRRKTGSALLISAFDQASGLWNPSQPHYRPRQLSLPARYLEKNVWLALESSVGEWSQALMEASQGRGAVPLTIWPELPPTQGGVCIYEGRLRDLRAQFEQERQAEIKIAAILCAPPRPNQAYWTLSALWAGWLWGHTASASFKSVLRRRRYDWGWHADALHSALENLGTLVTPETPGFALVGEAEPDFHAAILLAGEFAGLDLQAVALRSAQEQTQIHWKKRKPFRLSVVEGTRRMAILRMAMANFLRQSGEPTGFMKAHLAGLKELIQQHAALPVAEGAASEALRQINEDIGWLLSSGSPFAKPGQTSKTLESGQWWLDDEAVKKGQLTASLADRSEQSVLDFLQTHASCSMAEIDRSVCQDLPGLQTPDLELIQDCLDSYADPLDEGGDLWRLRAQENPAARQKDLLEMHARLTALGESLGFALQYPARAPETDPLKSLTWKDNSGAEVYRFYLIATAILGEILFGAKRGEQQHAASQRLIVLPAGRAGLVSAKMRRDPRLRLEIEKGWRFLKFRHVRLLSDSPNLSRENLEASLGLDPLANRDPKMLLL